MFENPRRGRQARNFTTNAPKILDLKSSSKQIFSRKLSLGAPVVCQHLFNRQMKQQQKIIYPNVYRNTINHSDSQMSLLPIFSEGGGTSVHRLEIVSVSVLSKIVSLE